MIAEAKVTKAKAAKKKKTPSSDKGAQMIKRLWGDVDVVDADHELRVTILPEDQKKATRKDPTCCVFAQACKRTFGATRVLFLLRYAYVELPNDDGASRVERFAMPPKMRALVEDFDKGRTVLPKGGFVLKPPAPSQRLDALAKRSSQRHAAAKKRLLNGKTEADPNRNPHKTRAITVDLDSQVRNGKGMVHFRIMKP